VSTEHRFTTLCSHVVCLPRNDIDTDQIIPARYLKVTTKHGLDAHLFADWRYREDGTPREDFVLELPQSKGARILVAGENFGCGSSREHAPWALVAWGFRAIVAPSFADIFRGNALKNGLLPVVVAPRVHGQLLALLEKAPSAPLTIDLRSKQLTLPDGTAVAFDVDEFSRHCLLEGIDELGYLLSLSKEVAVHEAAYGR
jgi:3-isopropylmalate/(R)-2-methylmalate dehydratase small subunit